MPDLPCPHCGQAHSPDAAVCPTVSASTAAERVPDKGVADILEEALTLYRRHAKALLLTCALLIVPASIVKSWALSAILGPTVEAAQIHAARAEGAARALVDAYRDNAAPEAIARLQAQQRSAFDALARAAATPDEDGVAIFVLGLFGKLITVFFLYGVIIPLTNGALTIAVGDRILGGAAGWREVWMLLFRRVGKLLSALIPSALLVALGTLCLFIPGVVLALFFAFVSPVVLIENIGGRAALRRSAALVRSDWLRVALVIVVLAVVQFAAQLVTRTLVPHGAIFFESLFGDLLTMLLLPVPILGIVLLYFDIRRKHESLTPDTLRVELSSLRSQPS